ncbi:MAG TPA: M20/M25/M40 family metallo-hydrolase [bacterium]|nr:M20/M25/M40 family metallo-hydrolase [bacterium]
MRGTHAALDRAIDGHLSLVEAIAAIPAPSFGEAERGAYIADRFREAGLLDVAIDEAGNVRGLFAGGGPAPRVVLAAHMDTVYPTEAHQPPRREGARLTGSSVRDNAAAVAALVTLARAMRDVGASVPCALEFASTTGEEGLGDLRGIRHRLRPEEVRPEAVLIGDGRMGQIVHQGIAVRRFAVRFETDGGHSWGDYGAPSAIHHLAPVIHALARTPLPVDPKTTLNVGVIHGGTSVNAIASTAEIQVDFRSVEAARVDELTALLRRLVEAEVAAGVRTTTKVIGDRPGGRISADHPLVAGILDVHRAHGLTPQLSASSTDANIPLSLGIAAVSMGVSGGGQVHSPREWLDTTSLLPGLHLLADAVAKTVEVAAAGPAAARRGGASGHP